ncbi:MAG: dipeptidase [Cyclobacteriaceae bacterium]
METGSFIEQNKDRFLNELLDLLRIPSVSADKKFHDDVIRMAETLKDKLEAAGGDHAEICETDGYPIVYGEKIVNENAPTVLVYGHYDVQPADPYELWDSPPFEPVIKNDKIYARGACDDKGQMYMHIKAFESLVGTDSLNCNVKFMIEGEEEVGSENLEIFVKNNHEKLKADVILVSDTAMISLQTPSITVGLRGLSYLEVEVTGPNRDLHSGVYGGAVANPINVLCDMIASLHDDKGRITIPGFYDKVAELTEEERTELNKAPFDLKAYKDDLDIGDVQGEEGYTTLERTGIRPTLDVNGIWGGYTGEGAKTVLPSKAHAKISMRLVPDQSSGEITELFKNHFLAIAPKSVKVRVTPHHGGEPAVTPTDSEAYAAAAAAFRDTFGKEPIPTRDGGSIPIVSLFKKELGLDTVLMGFGFDSDAIHSPNEHYGVQNYMKGIETICQLMKRFFVFLFILFPLLTQAQVLEPSKWNYSVDGGEVKVGDEVDLIFKAKIDPDWYLYSSDFDPDCGPMVTEFTFQPDPGYELVGELRAINPVEKYDEIFECDVRIFKKEGVFRQKVKILSADAVIAGSHEFQVCSDVTGQCIPFDYDFEFANFVARGDGNGGADNDPEMTPEKPEKGSEIFNSPDAETVDDPVQEETTETAVVQKPEISSPDYGEINGPEIDESIFDSEGETQEKQGLLGFMIVAFLAGLTALLTPCVFPMIPMTVTFFTRKGGVGKAIIYGVSIILIYTLIGAAVAPIMGPETANHLSTEWLPNLIFFAVFIFFALAFFGLFELTLPSGFVNKMDKKADKGGLVGVFFMAFTLVLVSFSCTGPIVGSILVASAGGEVLKPVLGMFAFAAAFAIPFTLFAIFPGLLNNLPKSGGWLNSVKVVLGFIELALAFKFLSIADQAYHWGILDRDINIAIWIVIFTLMGFYLLGKIRLPHDSKLEQISVPRLIFAIITFTFVIYLIPGLWGAPLKALAGYLPPMYTHDFDLISMNRETDDQDYGGTCEEPMYDDFLHLPHGLEGYFDYEQAMACARSLNKPLFIDFTGHGCTNCREMEAVVWSDPAVLQRLREDYVIAALYVDDKTELPESDWYTSGYDEKVKKTIGKQNADLQIAKLNNNAQPFYVLVGPDEKVLVRPLGYDKDVQNFVEFLELGKKRYQQRYEEQIAAN